jgi:hypothetical protein
MLRRLYILGIVLACGTASAQEARQVTATFKVEKQVQLPAVSIMPFDLEVSTIQGQVIDESLYQVDHQNAIIKFSDEAVKKYKQIKISYKRYPDFLTKEYKLYDENRIIEKSGNQDDFLSLQSQQKAKAPQSLFGDLNTQGSITRGLQVGNNQNASVNSELDLQIQGNLSPDVSIRASIQDANLPNQQGSYSQRLNEFDQVFIEINGPSWGIRAGDIDMQENRSFFGQYTKKVQGLQVKADLMKKDDKQWNAYAAGALVRGVFRRSEIQAQEGNQGPYKLLGPDQELLVLIISGSESVFVNGVRLERGENEDYMIDYNAGEIRFNSTYPINSEMRIVVEYQVSEQNYSRIFATAGSDYKSEKLNLRGFAYHESDLKDQPLQQQLTTEQVDVLQQAGDDKSQMVASGVRPAEFSENRVLYEKEMQNGEEIFVFSTDPEAELFQVNFTNVGTNQGNYILSDQQAIAPIYEYVPPENGVPQGNFAPVTQLTAPTLLQLGVVMGDYQYAKRGKAAFELALSANDENRFSPIDDADNDGIAGRLQLDQQLLDTDADWQLQAVSTNDFLADDFTSIERLYNVEFRRDWNIQEPVAGDRIFTSSGFRLLKNDSINMNYRFEHLGFSDNYSGNRHKVDLNYNSKKVGIRASGSSLQSNGRRADSEFHRGQAAVVYQPIKKYWIGARTNGEYVKEIENATQELTDLSQSFIGYTAFAGIGDSTDVFVEGGYRYRQNDSLRNNDIKRVNESNTYFLKSRPLKTKKASVDVYLNYRELNNVVDSISDEQAFNSRITYRQRLWERLLSLTANYETNSGTRAQQEFTFVEVNPGDGRFVWNDYNDNGVQELNEFEVAAFEQEADYLQVFLPNQIFLKTNETRFSQQLNLNFSQWKESEGFKKFVAHFQNNASFIIERELERDGTNFHFNPFSTDGQRELGLNLSIRNALFFNRGQQDFSTTYNYLNNASKSLQSVGLQETEITNHELLFVHKLNDFWLVDLSSRLTQKSLASENFANRNYELDGVELQPKLSYLLDENQQFDVFYRFSDEANAIGGEEQLVQNELGASFRLAKNEKYNINGEVSYISNDFTGQSFTPVAYEMMEGLQPGDNFTWRIFVQRKIFEFLDLNVNYFGRKSEGSDTVHTGNIQLRAFF